MTTGNIERNKLNMEKNVIESNVHQEILRQQGGIVLKDHEIVKLQSNRIVTVKNSDRAALAMFASLVNKNTHINLRPKAEGALDAQTVKRVNGLGKRDGTYEYKPLIQELSQDMPDFINGLGNSVVLEDILKGNFN